MTNDRQVKVTPASESAATLAARRSMVEVIRRYGLHDARVLAAMGAVRRDRFFPTPGVTLETAYGDHPAPIGWGQTISQPFIVAYMTERLCLKNGTRVLEVGTGSGYQAAILAACGAAVFSLERIPALATHARQVLADEGYAAVQVRCADGYDGWRAEAPFDAIIGTCAPAGVPDELVAQLADGGRMILPVGEDSQRLLLVRRQGAKITITEDIAVRFVPMVAGLPDA